MSLDPSVQSAIVTTLGVVAVAILGLIANGQRVNHKTMKAVKHQVQNSHETNLRDDIDRVAANVETLLANQADIAGEVKAQRSDLVQLRSDLAQERQERLAVSVRVDGIQAELR